MVNWCRRVLIHESIFPSRTTLNIGIPGAGSIRFPTGRFRPVPGEATHLAFVIRKSSVLVQNVRGGATVSAGRGQAIVLTLNFMELDGTKPDRKHKGGNDRRETVDFSLDSLMRRNLGAAHRNQSGVRRLPRPPHFPLERPPRE